jgi:hypothetical protein
MVTDFDRPPPRDMVALPPHLYSIIREAPGVWRVRYNLFGQNGVTVNYRKNKPNAHGWQTSRLVFDNGFSAYIYARSLLRPVPKDHVLND